MRARLPVAFAIKLPLERSQRVGDALCARVPQAFAINVLAEQMVSLDGPEGRPRKGLELHTRTLPWRARQEGLMRVAKATWSSRSQNWPKSTKR